MATQDEPVNDPLVSRETELFKAELLATVGHELRSPLTAIKGYAATLLRHERRISREERHELLLAIVAASDRLELLVERSLELSQLETDAIRIERFPVDVARLVRPVASLLSVGEPPDQINETLVSPKDAHLRMGSTVTRKAEREARMITILMERVWKVLWESGSPPDKGKWRQRLSCSQALAH